MYLIVGLGNPEPEYSKTRHNMGFDVINRLSKKFDINVNKEKFNALVGTGVIEGEKVILQEEDCVGAAIDSPDHLWW